MLYVTWHFPTRYVCRLPQTLVLAQYVTSRTVVAWWWLGGARLITQNAEHFPSTALISFHAVSLCNSLRGPYSRLWSA